MGIRLILAAAKLQESFGVTVGIFWEYGSLLVIDADFFYDYIAGISVRFFWNNMSS